MKTMTLANFDDYIKEKKPTVFIYDDNNNRDKEGYYYPHSEALFLSLTFENIKIYHHPNAITFKGKDRLMQLSYIDNIIIKENDTLLGDTVIIHTKRIFKTITETETDTFTFIMR